MRNWKGLAAGLVIGVAVSAAVYAQQAGGSRGLTQEDYAEIQRLYARFCWALDSRADNGMAYAKMFTQDGEFVYGTNKTVGREKLAGILRGNAPTRPPRHFAVNIIISPSPEGARGSAYLLQVDQPDPSTPPTLSTGTYDDILVKTSDGWRFKHREVVMGSLMPAGIQLLSSN